MTTAAGGEDFGQGDFYFFKGKILENVEKFDSEKLHTHKGKEKIGTYVLERPVGQGFQGRDDMVNL